jgi:hypothetical protein
MWLPTGKAIVMPFGEVLVNEYRHRTVFIMELLDHRSSFCLWNLKAGPAIPLKGCGFRQSTETRDESSRRHRESVRAIVRTLDSYRKSIRHKEQSALDVGFLDY